jgi:hypothetical protein
MAIKKEDIKEGYYWVSDRQRADELSIVLIAKWAKGLVALHPGYEIEDDLVSDFVDRFDFIARIEPPEGV